MTEARIVKFLTQVVYIKCYQKDGISPPKRAWLWSSGAILLDLRVGTLLEEEEEEEEEEEVTIF